MDGMCSSGCVVVGGGEKEVGWYEWGVGDVEQNKMRNKGIGCSLAKEPSMHAFLYVLHNYVRRQDKVWEETLAVVGDDQVMVVDPSALQNLQCPFCVVKVV